MVAADLTAAVEGMATVNQVEAASTTEVKMTVREDMAVTSQDELLNSLL